MRGLTRGPCRLRRATLEPGWGLRWPGLVFSSEGTIARLPPLSNPIIHRVLHSHLRR